MTGIVSPLVLTIFAIDAVAFLVVVVMFVVLFVALSDRRTVRAEFLLRKWRAHRRPPVDDHERLIAHASQERPQAAPPPIARTGPPPPGPATGDTGTAGHADDND